MASSDLGQLPQVHPRHDLVERARTSYMVRVLQWQQEFGLTACESLEIVTDELHKACASYVRAERRREGESGG